MSVSGEEIRQAKKFLENKKYSIKNVKPRLFAVVAKELQVKYPEDFHVVNYKNIENTQNLLAKIEAKKLENLVSKKIQKETEKITTMENKNTDEIREIISYKKAKIEKWKSLDLDLKAINNFQPLPALPGHGLGV